MRSFIILSFFIASCNVNILQKSQIKKFEKCLGKEIALNLDLSVVLLDSLLVEYYKDSENLDYMYSDFIKSIFTEDVDWERFFDNKDMLNNYYEQVVRSGLADELYLKYKGFNLRRDFADNENLNINDTAIRVIQIEYEYISKDSLNGLARSSSWLLSDSEKENIDSVVLHAKNEINLNMYNKYRKGLELVSKSNKLVDRYLHERKQYQGMVSPSLILKGWEEREIDYKDYFFKRVLATEILLLSDINKYAIQHAVIKHCADSAIFEQHNI